MIASTNKHAYPNTLIVILGQDKGRSHYEEKDQVTRVLDEDNNVIGFNFFDVDQYLNYDALANGEVELTAEDLTKLNQILKDNGFADQLVPSKPTLVYGYVKTCEAHPDSDHLHVTTVDVGSESDVKIVCGAPNIEAGELRGVPSYGMICSARELGLPHAPQKRGIMVVPDSFEVGQKFEPTKCDELLASGAITL